MPLNYSVEDEPLGTGGAIRQALDTLPDDEVVVLNGDTLFRVDLEGYGKYTPEWRGAALNCA